MTSTSANEVLLEHIEFGQVLCAVALEAAENDVGLTIDLTGGGYQGPHRPPANGDPTAITARDDNCVTHSSSNALTTARTMTHSALWQSECNCGANPMWRTGDD